MINQSDSIQYDKLGFDGEKYIRMQQQQILERLSKFNGRMYLEIGGKFLWDAHASRVLPWFDPESKKEIFAWLLDQAEIVYCANAVDLENNRQMSNEEVAYDDYVFAWLKEIGKSLWVVPYVVVNFSQIWKDSDIVTKFKNKLKRLGYQVFVRYFIEWYPEVDNVLSESWYGSDDYISLQKNLVLVTGVGSGSGKMSTCLGQMYHDYQNNIKSGYAKYETFPIWNLPLEHPVNLAYEAATADLWDRNCVDKYHQKAYGQMAINYNRDVESFELVMYIAKNIVNHKNYMRTYKSPTDMGISTAGFAILDDGIVKNACLDEIERRKAWYQQMVDRWEGRVEWVKRCEELLEILERE